MLKTTILTISILFAFSSYSLAQNHRTSALQLQIEKMDSLLFDVAFNQCNSVLFDQLIANDIEFYDDRTGLNISKAKEMASFHEKCQKSQPVTRRLISHEISPLANYGAVQTGVHEFLVDGVPVEKAKFITIWEKNDSTWQVKRAISYEHTGL